MDRHAILEERITATLAQLARLEQALNSGDLITVSRGAEVPSKLLAEIRSHTWLLRALVDSASGGHQAADEQPAADAIDELRAEWASTRG